MNESNPLVRVKDIIPSVYVELVYATPNNFMGQCIYTFREAYLRLNTAKKLETAQSFLLERGYSIKILDAFRPVEAQFKLWEIMPNDDFVANPNKGFSKHSRGCSVDITLVTKAGEELEMPSPFDDFTGKGKREYSNASPDARKHILLLEEAMRIAGFNAYINEWWHFNDSVLDEIVHDSKNLA